MQFSRVTIASLVHHVAPHVVRSSELESAIAPLMQRLGMPPGTLQELTGVNERRWFDPGVRPSQVATAAGTKALQQAGLTPGQVDVLVNGSVCRDFIEPATAALVSGELGLGPSAIHCDVSNACVGFLHGMWMVANMIELGQANYGLVVCGETARPGVTATLGRLGADTAGADAFRDNFATLTLGSGGAGAVLCRSDLAPQGHRLHGVAWRSDTRYSGLCQATETAMRVEPKGLLEHGVDCAVDAWRQVPGVMGWQPSDIAEVVLHQVGIAHHERTFSMCGIPIERGPVTFPYLGNTGPGSVPITLALRAEAGLVSKGAKVAMFGVGSGLGSLILGVEW